MRSVAPGLAGAPTSGRLRVRHGPAGKPAQRDGAVEHVLGHVAVLGELAADHADHARRPTRRRRGRATRRPCRPSPVSISGRSPAYAPMTSSGPSATSSAVLTVSSRNAISAGVGSRHIGNRPRRVLVGQPEVDPAQLFGHREHEAVDLAGDRNRQRRSRDCRTPRRRTPDAFRGWAAAGSTVSTSPAHTPVALITARADTSNDSPVRWSVSRHRGARRVRGRDAGQDARAVLGRGARDGDDQPRVVDQLTVVGEQAAAQTRRAARSAPVRPRARRRCAAIAAASTPVCRPACAARRRRRTRTAPAPRCAVFIDGSSGTSCGIALHEVRSVAGHQDSAFDRAAAGDADVAGGEVAQAAVHQLGAPPAGAERQVVLLHQHDAQPAGRGVQGDAGAGDAAADHDDVERLRRRPSAASSAARRAALSAVEPVMA